MRTAALAAALLLFPSAARAGLYCSEETVGELPAQWRGFLLDQRAVRLAAVKPTGTTAASPLRIRYQAAADRLTKTATERPLTADEAADLGALRPSRRRGRAH